MTREVEEEPLPAGWEIAMSRSKNMPYYFNSKTQKVYWVDDDLPRGWSHQFDADGQRFYFHIKNKADTTSYDKPVLRQRPRSPSPPRPSSPDASPQPQQQQQQQRPPHAERRRSNSLMELLSPRLPEEEEPMAPTDERNSDDSGARVHAQEASVAGMEGGQSPQAAPSSAPRSMSIAHLVSGSASPPRPGAPTAHGNPHHPPTNNSNTNSTRHGSSAFQGVKRSFDQISKDEDPGAAAAFYNQLQRNATADRAESLLFHMRALNNWVKSILIGEFSKRDDHVLDLACGKGGDLMKWAKRGIRRYVGADIAQKSLEDAVERVLANNSMQNREALQIQFVQGDLGRVSLLRDELHAWTRERGWHDTVPVERPGAFQLVSMQFSFHYMFGDEARATHFFRSLHELLADGGIFIATTVDPNKILHKFYQTLGATPLAHSSARHDGDHDGTDTDTAAVDPPRRAPDVRITDERAREVCAIRFDDTIREALVGYDAPTEGAFGLRYNFTLRDTDDAASGGAENGGGDAAVDLPEYLVPDDLLRRLLREHGFELLLQQNFHPYILQHLEGNRSLLDKMHVMNFAGTLSEAEWEIAGLYQVLAFKKIY